MMRLIDVFLYFSFYINFLSAFAPPRYSSNMASYWLNRIRDFLRNFLDKRSSLTSLRGIQKNRDKFAAFLRLENQYLSPTPLLDKPPFVSTDNVAMSPESSISPENCSRSAITNSFGGKITWSDQLAWAYLRAEVFRKFAETFYE